MTISRDDLEQQAKRPERLRTEEGTVKERSVKELIDADRYGKQVDASEDGPPWGMSVASVAPAGPQH